VIGAGGLGVPVLQFLAGAGVGQLTIIDADHLDASNLHRQTWYALNDCGRPKAELAAERIRALNPDVSVQVCATRLDGPRANELLQGHDLLIDCVDNFRSKFLLNDWAQVHGVPLITASVHQFEGQLQIIDPRRSSSCLRCQWPQATEDGLIGNCAEAGVLGPTPGVLGGLQALEAIKLLLDLPDRLQGELLLVDLLNLQMTRVRAPRRTACGAACELAESALRNACQMAADAPAEGHEPTSPLELIFDDLAAAQAAGFQLIDIREHPEIEQQPLPVANVPHRPMFELLSGQNLPQEGRYLLICARGQRSLTTARKLRERGLDAYSLQGGASRWADCTPTTV
jgi:adenylyltransferase/sulfurtransferase